MRCVVFFFAIIYLSIVVSYTTQAQSRGRKSPTKQKVGQSTSKTPPTEKQAAQQKESQSTNEVFYLFRKPSSTDSSGATANQKLSGQLIEGEIKGLIVQKFDTNKPNASAYRLTKGKDITAINESGVQVQGTALAVAGINDDESKPVNDLSVIGFAEQHAPMSFGAVSGPNGRTSVMVQPKVYGQGLNSEADLMLNQGAVLGEYRCEGGNCKIIPALEVITEKGTFIIPVNKLVRFGSK